MPNAQLEEWQKRYQCAKCSTIVWSKFANQTSRCSCGAIAVEQAPWMNCKMGKDEDFLDPNRNIIFGIDVGDDPQDNQQHTGWMMDYSDYI